MLSEWFKEEHWLQGASAKNKEGEEVHPSTVEAYQFDLTSAINVSYATKAKRWEVTERIRSYLKIRHKFEMAKCATKWEKVGGQDDGMITASYPLWKWNDLESTTWDDIVDILNWTDV